MVITDQDDIMIRFYLIENTSPQHRSFEKNMVFERRFLRDFHPEKFAKLIAEEEEQKQKLLEQEPPEYPVFKKRIIGEGYDAQ